MTRIYTEDPLSIMLIVIATNSDIAIADGLMLAKKIHTSGLRTIEFITKLDIIDAGKDAKKY